MRFRGSAGQPWRLCWNKVNIMVCHRRTYLLTFSVGAIIKHGADNNDKSEAGGKTTEVRMSSERPYQCRPELVERGNTIKAAFTGESSLSRFQTALCSLSFDRYLKVFVFCAAKKNKYTDTSIKRGLSSYFTFSILSCHCNNLSCYVNHLFNLIKYKHWMATVHFLLTAAWSFDISDRIVTFTVYLLQPVCVNKTWGFIVLLPFRV